MIYCTKCGRQNADNARFCISCGNPINNFQATQPIASQTQYVMPTNTMQQNTGIKCPRCRSTNLQAVSDVQGKGASFCKLCICGLPGLCGAGKTTTEHFWVCQNCGNKFKM